VGLLFATISIIGWLGFTLSFLILLILYSTLVVVFWSFFIAFEESKKKKEKQRLSLFFIPLSLVFLLPTFNVTSHVPSVFSQVFTLNFFQPGEPNEFFFFFLIIYVFNPVTFFFVFIILIVVCFNIVSLLLIKQRGAASKSSLYLNFNNAYGNPGKPTASGRSSFWSTVSSNLSFLTLNKTLRR